MLVSVLFLPCFELFCQPLGIKGREGPVRGLFPALSQTPRRGGRGERMVIFRLPTRGFPQHGLQRGPDWDMSDFTAVVSRDVRLTGPRSVFHLDERSRQGNHRFLQIGGLALASRLFLAPL
jgi:hypothetical protein